MTEEDWDAIHDLNMKGLFFLTQTLVKPMIERKSGKIVNISSTMGLVGGPLRTAYAASKGGVVLLTKGLAVEWAPDNVTVNAVAPAFTRTPLADVLLSAWTKLNLYCSPQCFGHESVPSGVFVVW